MLCADAAWKATAAARSDLAAVMNRIVGKMKGRRLPLLSCFAQPVDSCWDVVAVAVRSIKGIASGCCAARHDT